MNAVVKIVDDKTGIAPIESNTLVALTPSDMKVAQQQLGEFIYARKVTLDADFKELSSAYESAHKNGWATKALKNQLNKVQRRIVFYDKMLAAVEAGYVIMPSLPMDVIAIRTRLKVPRSSESTASWHQFEQAAQALPAGEGEYQNPTPTRDNYQDVEKDSEGNDKHVTKWFPVAFENDLEMPVELCKPQLLDGTRAAMAIKLFDEIGVVRDDAAWGRPGDPMVVGTILDPTRGKRRFAFFLAWALPLSAI
jgi:hypothetical protein